MHVNTPPEISLNTDSGTETASDPRQMLSAAIAAEGSSEMLRPLAQLVLDSINADGTARIDSEQLLVTIISALTNLEGRIIALEEKTA